MPDNDRTRSVARTDDPPRHGAFDGVRRELAVVLLAGVIAALVVVGLDLARWLELVLLAIIGFAAGGWVAIRTRAAERIAAGEAMRDDGAE
ncbi:hypothetical protein [Arhodomonas sp. AD133]|uniref:hypothetical protein n=1 Tax=Arhodomonas sp. AD133 TaxID=3415009 RepID=UPI003EBBBD95